MMKRSMTRLAPAAGAFSGVSGWAAIAAIAALAITASPAYADRVQIESAVIDSVSGKKLDVSKSDGDLNTFFTMQKKVVYDTLRGIGISVDSLPPEVRANLAKFHTQNFEAFRAFSSGLNAMDEGKFAEAKAFFDRATELDPDFALARDMQFAMPQTNAYSGLLLQAALREAAKNATTSGKTQVEVDASRAVAALLAGQTVTVGTRSAPAVDTQASVGPAFTTNVPGSADQFGTRSVVAINYSIDGGAASIGIASTNEWSASQVSSRDGQLAAVGDSSAFVAHRGGAGTSGTASATLPDGTVVNWGTWNSATGASASITSSGTVISYPQLETATHYMMAPATVAMPTSGTAVFAPTGGFLTGVTGSIGVNFVTRDVQINNLGFTLGGMNFAVLNGQAKYSSAIASGFFSGNYSSGFCTGCTAFSPTASAFTGNFAGENAGGLIFSSIMSTGSGTAAGLHLFSR